VRDDEAVHEQALERRRDPAQLRERAALRGGDVAEREHVPEHARERAVDERAERAVVARAVQHRLSCVRASAAAGRARAGRRTDLPFVRDAPDPAHDPC
jgi:hypothetical protein